jgi:hypothetical protein
MTWRELFWVQLIKYKFCCFKIYPAGSFTMWASLNYFYSLGEKYGVYL